MAEIAADVYIHAAPAAVYRRFTDITAWPDWYPGVASARWVRGADWREDAQFALRVRHPLGTMAQGTATVRMRVPHEIAVWEMNLPGLDVVCTARFEEDVGGCKLILRQTYHGALAWLMPLLGGAQRRAAADGLAALKRLIEGQPRR